MRPMSKAAKAEAYDALKSDRDTLSEVTWHLLNGHTPDASETISHDGDTYEYQLYGALRMNGGVLVQVFQSPGQSHGITVHRFDDWLATMKDWPYGDFYTDVRNAADKLRITRQRMYDKEKESA